MTHHAVLRANRPSRHVPLPQEELLNLDLGEALCLERRLHSGLHLRNSGEVGAQDSPTGLVLGGSLDGVPRLGDIEDDPLRDAPGTARVTVARCSPRMASVVAPPRARPMSSIFATVPTRAYPPSMRGTIRTWPSASAPAAAAARASAVSTAMVTTMPGSTTPPVNGSRGRAATSRSGVIASSVSK